MGDAFDECDLELPQLLGLITQLSNVASILIYAAAAAGSSRSEVLEENHEEEHEEGIFAVFQTMVEGLPAGDILAKMLEPSVTRGKQAYIKMGSLSNNTI
jgi:hypothetical protein